MSDYNCNHLVTRYDLGNTYCAKCNRWLYAGMSKPESVSPAPAQPERPICQSCKETIHLREDGEWAHEDNAMECFIGPHSPKAWPLRFRRGVAYERPAAPAQEVKWYVKKPIPLVAKQWSQAGDHDSVIAPPPHCTADSDMRCEKCGCASGIHGWIQTLEGGNDGAQLVCPGDWIITGIRGEHYPCKPDIFADMYYEEGADNYVAWLKYKTHNNGSTSISVCDSDTKGAFKVYRHAVDHEEGKVSDTTNLTNEKLKEALDAQTRLFQDLSNKYAIRVDELNAMKEALDDIQAECDEGSDPWVIIRKIEEILKPFIGKPGRSGK